MPLKKDLNTLKMLCSIPGTPGDESLISTYILDYVKKEQKSWKSKPQILSGEAFQDCIILVFGKAKTALFAHMDTVGYVVGYNNQLINAGSPSAKANAKLTGKDSKGVINCRITTVDKNFAYCDCERDIDRGTRLTYVQDFKLSDDYVSSCYLDDRMGILSALKVAETLENGAIVFSCWEESGGGSVQFLTKYLYEKLNIKQALISDITWVTEGIKDGKGVAISIRDSGIPRKTYIDRIISLAEKSGIDYQLEVESAGGSDGNVIHHSPYPVDWCFVGAPELNVHSPEESVHLHDFKCMYQMHRYLMKHL
jgi:putative aminopeptidase FrvX